MKFTVDLGISSARDFFFLVAWPNYNDFIANQSVRTAINAAWTFSHLAEWHLIEVDPETDLLARKEYREKSAQYRKHIQASCPQLGWLADIFDAAKHRRLDRSSVVVESVETQAFSGTFGDTPFGAVPFGGSRTDVYLTVSRHRHSMWGALQDTFIFWLGRLLPHHVQSTLPPENWKSESEWQIEWCRSKLGIEGVEQRKWALVGAAQPPASYVQRLAFADRAVATRFESALADRGIDSVSASGLDL